jgi:hypothetical protein
MIGATRILSVPKQNSNTQRSKYPTVTFKYKNRYLHFVLEIENHELGEFPGTIELSERMQHLSKRM